MGSSRGFGSTPPHKAPSSDSLSLRLRPSTALTCARRSNSPAHSSIGTPSPSRALTACRRTVSGSFHPPSGVLFTFPSRYSSTIGRHEYSALEGGPPSFPRNSTCSAVLRCPITRAWYVSPTGLSPAPAGLPRPFDYTQATGEIPAGTSTGSYNPPAATPAGLARLEFGLLPVRSPLLGESRLISAPRGTEMFQFPRLPRTALWIRAAVTAHHRGRVAPFGNRRITAR
jgi:hypothetical protein